MFFKEDQIYNELLEKSVEQWLEGMGTHEDIEVRSGVRASENYIEVLKKKIVALEQKNETTEKYLKKLKQSSL